MTPKKAQSDENEGILEEMLRSLRTIGQNVDRIVYRLDFYSTGAGREDDEWSADEPYENGEY